MNMQHLPKPTMIRDWRRVIIFSAGTFCLFFLLFSQKIYAQDTTEVKSDSLGVQTPVSEEVATTPAPAVSQPVAAFTGDPHSYSKTDYRKGSRLFQGLIPFESGTHNCASCHYIKPTQEINWNPSAYELAKAMAKNENYKLMDVMNLPASLRLMEDHKGMTITTDEARFLEAYLHKIDVYGPGELPAYPIRAAIFWGFGLLMLLALIDLLITKKIKYYFIHAIVLLVGLGVHMQFAYAEGKSLGRTPGYEPDQPIKFSHKIHAGENEIDCRYCHHIADHSLSAGIPSTNVCLNCHTVIRNGTNSGRFEINKIHYSAEHNEPVQWIRIHNLPNHSYFSHAQHVNTGRLDCAECHGQVEEMHIVRQVEDLSMGWCLNCHRTRKVDFAENPYYQMFDRLHDDLKNGRIDSISPAMVGATDCMKCHY